MKPTLFLLPIIFFLLTLNAQQLCDSPANQILKGNRIAAKIYNDTTIVYDCDVGYF